MSAVGIRETLDRLIHMFQAVADLDALAVAHLLPIGAGHAHHLGGKLRIGEHDRDHLLADMMQEMAMHATTVHGPLDETIPQMTHNMLMLPTHTAHVHRRH